MSEFPTQQARTRRHTLGVPRGLTVSTAPRGAFVVFLRSDSGDDPVNHLWRWDAHDGRTRKLVDARSLASDDAELPPAERALRERAREMAGGITGYATDDAVTIGTFALAGRLFTVALDTGEVAEHPTSAPAFDPRVSPDGRHLAYHAADALHVVDLRDHRPAGSDRVVAVEPGVCWGRAEFVAAEEMGRSRGFWWSSDGAALAVTRVDERDVPMWTIADPANPWSTPARHHYPVAGSVNADVSLWVVELSSGNRIPVVWDRSTHEYLADVQWGSGPLTLVVQSRDQRELQVLTADPATGVTQLVRRCRDETWVELVPGSPRWYGDRLVTVEDRHELGEGGTRAVCLDGEPVTPPGLQVRELLDVASEDPDPDRAQRPAVTFLASGEDPTEVHVHELVAHPSGSFPLDRFELHSPFAGSVGAHRLVRGSGVPAAGGGAPPTVHLERSLDRAHPRITVRWSPAPDSFREQELEVVAETPVLTARPRFLELGPRRLRAALFLPDGDDGRSSLPVLLDPYGGPHGQRVVRAQSAHLTSQWFANQGFAVLVVDGRGSPGRGPAFERAVRGDLATPVLDDQVDALEAAAGLEPRLDLGRVGIRGWSFGGFLAALALLRRPEVFRAAVAGAPVTDWRLYDTHYTERYLGDPEREAEAYLVSSLVDPGGRLLGANRWDEADPPQLLLIHGLADDNVVAAHSLRLSSALLTDGRLHRFLPLSGVTHMTPQEVVAERLLTLQVRFLRDALG